jgi:SAM-dependent methyltransferase
MEFITQHVARGGKVLDLAGGAGAFSARLTDAGYSVTGNDIDDEHWAAPQVPKLSIDLNKPFEAALEPGSYAAVVAMEVIEHLNNPVKLLEDCRRLVAPGGCILISTPNVLDIESRLTYLRSGFPFHFSPQSFFATGHRTILPYWLLELLFDEAGLVIEKRQWGGPLTPSGRQSGLGGVLNRVLRASMRLLVKNSTPGLLDANFVVYLLRVRQQGTA